MDNDAKIRAMCARISARTCATHPDALGVDPPRDAEGRRLIIHALAHDSIHQTIDALRRSGSDRASVAVVEAIEDDDDKRGIRVHILTVAKAEGETSCDVGKQCTWLDLLKVLEAGSSITITTDGSEITFDEASVSDVADSVSV